MHAQPRPLVDIHGISPPSSPDTPYIPMRAADIDVSPLDDDPDSLQKQMLTGSRPLPIHPLRQAPTRFQAGGCSPKSNNSTMRRDHRAKQEAAVPTSTTPPMSGSGHQAPADWEQHYPQATHAPDSGHLGGDERLGLTTTIVSQTTPRAKAPSPSFGQRMRQLGRSKPQPILSRPPWNGASGRQALPTPIYDDPSAPRLSVPDKQSRTNRAKGNHSNSDTIGATDAGKHSAPNDSAGQVLVHGQTPTGTPGQQPGSIPVAAAMSPAINTRATNPDRPDSRMSLEKSIRRKLHPSVAGSISGQNPQSSVTKRPSATPDLDSAYAQPSSRFSITTYATSAHGSRHSDEERPPLPEAPRKMPSGMDSNMEGRPPSFESLAKALPPAPPEMVDSADRVTLLNAKLEGLAHRRQNISRGIKQMTELMPADRLIESAEVMRKREEEKKKVEKLKEELAEVQQQEYDLGLKLHRAYKRQDREDDYESGTLWVRRVTS